MFKKLILASLLGLVATVLIACGGGNDSSGTSNSTFANDAAISALAFPLPLPPKTSAELEEWIDKQTQEKTCFLNKGTQVTSSGLFYAYTEGAINQGTGMKEDGFLKHPSFPNIAYSADIYEKADSTLWEKHTTKDYNFVPRKGDIVVWGANPGYWGDAGHVALVLENLPSSENLRVLEQRSGECVRESKLPRTGVKGYLRPKNLVSKEIMGFINGGKSFTGLERDHYLNNITILVLHAARVTSGGALDTTEVKKDSSTVSTVKCPPNPDNSTTSVPPYKGDIVQKAHDKGIPVLLSIVHCVKDKSAFGVAIQDKGQRDRIVSDAQKLVETLGLDGINVDFESWEDDYSKQIEQATHLSALWQELRSKLPQGYLLTASLNVGRIGEKVYTSNNNNMLDFLDFANVMAYDKVGPGWGTVVGHHAPYEYFKDGANKLMAQGFPKNKILMGIPFYGIQFKSLAPKFEDATQLTYKEIVGKSLKNDLLFWDGIPEVERKAQYVSDQDLGGVMIWELTQDYYGKDYADSSQSLLYAIRKALDKSE